MLLTLGSVPVPAGGGSTWSLAPQLASPQPLLPQEGLQVLPARGSSSRGGGVHLGGTAHSGSGGVSCGEWPPAERAVVLYIDASPHAGACIAPGMHTRCGPLHWDICAGGACIAKARSTQHQGLPLSVLYLRRIPVVERANGLYSDAAQHQTQRSRSAWELSCVGLLLCGSLQVQGFQLSVPAGCTVLQPPLCSRSVGPTPPIPRRSLAAALLSLHAAICVLHVAAPLAAPPECAAYYCCSAGCALAW
jgi:hypothetical protein